MTTNSKPMTDADLSAIERGIESGDLTHGHVHQLIAEVRRLQAERGAAFHHLDAILAGYAAPGLGPLIRACQSAQAWRGVKTSQDAPGATQST